MMPNRLRIELQRSILYGRAWSIESHSLVTAVLSVCDRRIASGEVAAVVG